MIDSRRIMSALALSVTASASAYGEDAVSDNTWKANVEIGYVTTDGNTQTESLNAKAKAEMEREKWRHTVNLEALNSSDSGVSTAERYMVSGQSNFNGREEFFLCPAELRG